jgi:hypothetical protein
MKVAIASKNGAVANHPKKKRVVVNGHATNELVLSASTDGNECVFPKILQLYVAPGSVVADVTYGKGVFWRNVPCGAFELRATDIQDGVDCRNLPYENGELDCFVFDPPYMHTPGGTAHASDSSHAPFEEHSRNNGTGNQTESKYHEAVEKTRRLYRKMPRRSVRQPPEVHAH